MIEKWHPVLGFEEDYSVSNLGRVRRETGNYGRGKGNGKGGSSKAVPGRILCQTVRPDGYSKVNLCDGKRRCTRLVHQLVCEAFHGPRPQGMVVCHEDGVRSNCRADNLSWNTQSKNMSDRWRHERLRAVA